MKRLFYIYFRALGDSCRLSFPSGNRQKHFVSASQAEETMTTSSQQQDAADHVLLGRLTVKTPKGTRRLTKAECEDAIQFFAIKANAQTFDIRKLTPRGSLLDLIARHFGETDISYALPIMQTVMIAASYLTQKGATLKIPGVGEVCPTLWLVGLAGSGSSKTFASEEIDRILSRGNSDAVARLATGCTDAQWIVELHDNNGAFWFQDEVGKTFNAILTQGSYIRIKEWVLNAYSHKAIANRLKSEKNKLVIDRPYFTFHGLSVDETWCSDIDLTSMLDGFCQRFNYYIATPRQDTDIFDHFLYFEGQEVEERRELLVKTWDAICSQKDAYGPYTMNDGIRPLSPL